MLHLGVRLSHLGLALRSLERLACGLRARCAHCGAHALRALLCEITNSLRARETAGNKKKAR